MTHRPATLLLAMLMLAGFLQQLVVAKECCASTGLEVLMATTFDPVVHGSGAAPSNLNFRTDWWRLVTSMFVHAGILHFVINIISLLQIGDLLESLFRSPIVIASFLIGGTLAALATIHFAPAGEAVIYMGASGGIFALAGTLLAASHRIWRANRARWSGRLSSRLVGCLGFNLVLGLIASAAATWGNLGFAVGHIAHLTGLTGGILLGLLPIPMQQNERTAMIIRWFDPPPPAADTGVEF